MNRIKAQNLSNVASTTKRDSHGRRFVKTKILLHHYRIEHTTQKSQWNDVKINNNKIKLNKIISQFNNLSGENILITI